MSGTSSILWEEGYETLSRTLGREPTNQEIDKWVHDLIFSKINEIDDNEN